MQKTKRQKLFVALLLAALLVMSVAPAVFAQDATTTTEQAAMQSKVTGVSGMLPGGQFAKMWLGLTPSQPGATIVVTAEWDRANADDSGVGFFILDQTGLAAVQNGSGTVVLDNIAAGSQNFFLNGPNNKQGASIRATGTDYTIVMYNDSASDANFNLKVENGYLTDDSNQVTVDTTVGGTPVATEAATAAPTTAPTVVATPVAATAATTTTTSTTTTTTTAAAPTTATTTAPAGPVRATVMEGELPAQFDQHFLSLEPDVRDGTVTLSMTFDPQDSQELARRLNFIVLDEQGFKSYLDGESAFSLAKAAGSRDVVGAASNERQATFEVTGFGPYTAIVYNNSNVPAMYKLAAKGGILSDDSGQTITAKNAGGTTTVAAAGATTTVATTAGTTTAAAAAAPAAAESTGREGEPGGTYTVKSGDTLALIARDIYGDYRLYEQICAFNSLANCDAIEIGDVIKLPTNAQIQSGATAAPAAAAAPATAATPAATPTTAAVASTTVVTTTSATTTTATTTTAPTTAVTSTTGTVTTTKPATTTTGTGASGAGAAGSIMDVAKNSGQFTILLDALTATGLDEALAGSGPFTVFAPTDAAFNALLTGNNLTEDDLLRARELADILKYHVLSGKVLSADVTNGLKATTLQGKQVTFEVKDGKLFVNGAEVVGNDIPAGNGVIHAISAVILPPQ